MRNALIFAHLHNIQRLMQPIKIRQFRQKAQNQRQFGRGMAAKLFKTLSYANDFRVYFKLLIDSLCYTCLVGGIYGKLSL